MMKKAFFLYPLFLTLSFALNSLDQSSTPFPSNISAEAGSTSVIITWKDSPSLSGEVYHVYRSNRPLTTENLSDARLIDTVDRGTGEFRDHPPGGQDWYYTVTAEDNRGHYPMGIPFVNATTQPVRIDPKNIIREEAVKVSALNAQPLGDSVVITFQRDRDDRTVSLYRSTSPITTTDQLNQSLLIGVLEGDQHTWKDKPVPGISYYYAALDRDLLTLNEDTRLMEQGNHTLSPVSVSLSQFLDNPSLVFPVRKAPLPTLQLEKYYANLPRLQISFPPEKPLPPKLQKRVDAFLSTMGGEKARELLPRILPEDGEEDASPLEGKLQQILGEYFIKERWEHAERALLLLMQEGDDPEFLARLHYYRGQCYFFQAQYEPAYLEFLLSRESYYSESLLWMEPLLNQFL